MSVDHGRIDLVIKVWENRLVNLSLIIDIKCCEDFFTFDRHNIEQWLIGVVLFPILQEEYGFDENTEISNQYRIKVIDYIVDSVS